MKENKLEERKLSLIQKFNKWYVLRKMDKKGIEIWEKIKDSMLKNDRDVIEKAWKSVYESRDFSKFNLFPEGIKIEKGSEDENVIQYFHENTQYSIASKMPERAIKCSEQVQKTLIKEKPMDYILYVQRSVQEEMMPLLDTETQKNIIGQEPQLIMYAEENVKKDILVKKEIASKEWQTVINNESNLTLDKLVDFFQHARFGVSEEKDSLKEVIKFFSGLSDKNELVRQVRELDIKQRKKIIKNMIDDGKDIFTTNDLGPAIFDIMIENSDIIYDESHGKVAIVGALFKFKMNIVYEKFAQKYGNEKLEQYKSIIEQAWQSKDHKLIKFLFVDEGIIKNVSSDKVLNYIKNWTELEKEERLISMKGLPNSLDIKKKRRQLKGNFDEIIFDAYGEKARKIVENRPGLTLRDIENTEILAPNVTNNFREGFIHDLLSYDVEGINDFVRISQNQDDLEAFKLLYSRMSNKLGENITTMQMCISRFHEYSSILKDANKQELSEEQLENLEKVCSWPVNICKIQNVNELTELPSKFKNAINAYPLFCRDARLLGKKLETDIMSTNLSGETVIFDYLNPQNMSLETLSIEEKQLLNFCCVNTDDYDSNPLYISFLKLKQAVANDIDISSIFLNQYTLRKKIKEEEMKQFNEELTNKEKIYEAEKEGKYGTKTMKVGDIELIDFGNMPVNFASHDPNMNNSEVLFYNEEAKSSNVRDEYLIYDGENGVSTISATPIVEKTDALESKTTYLYWNFKENEVMSLKNDGETERTHGDGNVSHRKKQIVSTGESSRPIKRI